MKNKNQIKKETICLKNINKPIKICFYKNKRTAIEKILKYIDTKCFKFLLYCGRGTMQVSQDVFRFVPLQDFTSNSDIDWSVSIPEIDEQLYEKYGLSEDEIAFIEKMIKPM